MALKFYYNGIKANGGRLELCWYDMGPLHSDPNPRIITIRARDYRRFSDAVRAAFTVENNSDGMTDYFENDHIRVRPSHPLYAEVLAAHDKRQARWAARRTAA